MSKEAPQFRHGEVVRIRGERWRIVSHVGYGAAAIVDAAGCDATNRAAHARFLLPFEPVTTFEATCAPRVVRPGRWRHVARGALAEACPTWASLRAATRAHLTLIPFQLEPALALVRGDACRFLIADAVGLGKTVQAGLMIAETLQRRPGARAIVISPAGLREQWRHELGSRFALHAEILDAAALAHAAAQLPADLNPWAVPPLVITSIDYVKRPEVMRSLEALTWDVVVFDEAHNLAGRSDRAAAAALLGHRARVLVLLTATPHSGDDETFRRLCTLGNLTGTEPLALFRRTRADAGVGGTRRASLLRVRPTPAEAAMHDAVMAYTRLVWEQAGDAALNGARLAACVLARRACSSAESLARSVERRLTLLGDALSPPAVQAGLPFAWTGGDDEEPEALLGLAGLRSGRDERLRLTELLGLARAAARSESKIAALRRLLSRTDEPVIVFTEYRDTLQRLAATLGHVEVAQLHGGLTARERRDALARFTEGGSRVLLATDAGSEGLNLHQRCRLVINLELPWTPLRLEQRAGRIDRIGQARRVHVVHLVAGGTCEESTLARLVRRMHRLRGALSFGHLPDERQVADSVFGGCPVPDLACPPADIPPGVITLTLRDEAREEAARIHRARALCPQGGEPVETSRPVMTHVRRRPRGTTAPQCLWLFKLVFTGSSGHVVWESLLPFRSELAGTSGHSAALTRAVLTTDRPALQALLWRSRDDLLRALRHSMHGPLHRWGSRERELIAGLRSRHARLSTGLLQRGLFDRHDERRLAAQAAVLDQAIAQSAGRIAELADAEHVQVDSCDLIFAVVLE